MRVLATAAFSFSVAVLTVVLMPEIGWYVHAAAALAVMAVAALLFGRRRCWGRRAALIGFSAAAALLYFTGYQQIVQQPVLDQCGREASFTGVVCSYGTESTYGAKVTVRIDGSRFQKAVLYGDESLLSLRPGNVVTGTAQWNDASHINENRLTTFTSRGVYALLYQRGELSVSEGTADSVRWWPVRMNRAFQEKIRAVWADERVSAFVAAELTGDKYDVSDEDYTVMKGAGLAHLFAVSGLHCAFLVTLLALLLPRHRRRLFCGVTIGVLLFYMCMVGMTPSVVRACIMQIFLLIAPLFKRDSDPLTSLGAALLVILLCNPFAAASVSLQLSFAATFGIVLLSGRLYHLFYDWYQGARKWLRRALSFGCANLAVSLSAIICTVPLTAYYFNTLSLVSPLASLLAVPIAGYSFVAAFITVLVGFVGLPLARLLGWLTFGLIQAVLWLAYGLTRWRYHAVSFDNPYLRIWLAGSYLGFGLCAMVKRWRKRKYFFAAAVSVLTLLLAVWGNTLLYRAGDMNVTVMDVGQGESVALYANGEAMLVDCGSSNSFVDAGARVSNELEAMGFHHLKAVVVTHFHADHTNGLYTLLTRLRVDTLYLPDIEDEYGVRERLVELAGKYGIDVVWVTRTTLAVVGDITVTLYPPVGEGDMNEQGLSVLGSANDLDVLITGDMKGDTERALMKKYPIPDIEILVVGHHGSKYSSDETFLAAIKPEIAVISVGDNSYGHPAPEAVQRLESVGAAVRRTDEEGSITIHGGEEYGGE